MTAFSLVSSAGLALETFPEEKRAACPGGGGVKYSRSVAPPAIAVAALARDRKVSGKLSA